MRKLLFNKEGVVLPVVLIVMVVLIILGLALLYISDADGRQAIYQEKKLKAHYLARSGADAVASAIIKESSVLTDILDKASNPNTQLDGGSFTVEVIDVHGDQTEIEIVSTGTVDSGIGSINEKVSITLHKTINGGFFSNAIFATGKITLEDGSLIKGDVATNLSETDGEISQSNVDGTITYESPIAMPSFELPEGLPHHTLSPGSIINSSVHKIGDVKIGEDENLTFNTGDVGDLLQVRIDGQLKLEEGGELVLTGLGRLVIYVDSYISENAGITNDSGANLLIIATSTSIEAIKLEDLSVANAHFYAPNGGVKLENNIEIIGSIYAKEIKAENTIKVTYSALDETGIGIGGESINYEKGLYK